MVRLQYPRWALAAPAPRKFHRPLSALFPSGAFRSTDVSGPVFPRRGGGIALGWGVLAGAEDGTGAGEENGGWGGAGHAP